VRTLWFFYLASLPESLPEAVHLRMRARSRCTSQAYCAWIDIFGGFCLKSPTITGDSFVMSDWGATHSASMNQGEVHLQQFEPHFLLDCGCSTWAPTASDGIVLHR
jgi:hypothetical protein